MKRRSFLKILGAGIATAVAGPALAPMTDVAVITPPAAPLYIPPQNLAYGVPSGRLLTARDMPVAHAVQRGTGTIPMLLRQSEFLLEFGGKLPAGSTVMVDQTTAERWIANDVAVPGPTAPREMQDWAAKRLAARRVETMSWSNAYLNVDEIAVVVPIPARHPDNILNHASRTGEMADLLTQHLRRLAPRKPAPDIVYSDDEFVVWGPD